MTTENGLPGVIVAAKHKLDGEDFVNAVHALQLGVDVIQVHSYQGVYDRLATGRYGVVLFDEGQWHPSIGAAVLGHDLGLGLAAFTLSSAEGRAQEQRDAAGTYERSVGYASYFTPRASVSATVGRLLGSPGVELLDLGVSPPRVEDPWNMVEERMYPLGAFENVTSITIPGLNARQNLLIGAILEDCHSEGGWQAYSANALADIDSMQDMDSGYTLPWWSLIASGCVHIVRHPETLVPAIYPSNKTLEDIAKANNIGLPPILVA